MKFAPNISTMFTEFPFLDRFTKAKEFGFDSVEIQFPYEFSTDELQQHTNGMQCNLVNILCGDSANGCGASVGQQDEFMRCASNSAKYFYVLNFKKLHILSGLKHSEYAEEQREVFISNLKTLVECDFLERMNVTGLIEPICSDVIPGYFLDSFDLAVDIIKEVNSDQIKLLLDIYHLHKITGDVKSNLDLYYPYAGHIQVSQDPDRREPFHEGGLIDYDFVFNYLKEKKYKDAIGLEYFPSGSTAQSLMWMKQYC